MTPSVERTLSVATRLHACGRAKSWLKSIKKKTSKEVWETNFQPEWMLWYAGKLEVDHRRLVAAGIGLLQGVKPRLSLVEKDALYTLEDWVKYPDAIRPPNNPTISYPLLGHEEAIFKVVQAARRPEATKYFLFSMVGHLESEMAVPYRRKFRRECARRIAYVIPWFLIEEAEDAYVSNMRL